MVIALSSAHSEGQVMLDGTLGRAGALPGPNYAITADLGQQVGGNLFHSFQTFSIQRSESATFSGPPSVSNIISRVTGGQISTIDGALRSTIPGAHLYLLNPAGVLFGEHARLEVPGSVHVSTADYLRLSDGGRFDAGTPANSVLTVAPVEAFGFLGATPGRIEIQGSFLQAPAGQTLSLIGGDLRLTNATVYAPAGRLNIADVGSAGEVIPTDQALLLEGFDQLGILTMARDSSVERIRVDQGEPWGAVPLADLDVSSAGGGSIFIRGGQWINQGGEIAADTYGAQDGQDMQIEIAGLMQFADGAWLEALTGGTGSAGSITIAAGALSLHNSQILASTFAGGDAGSLLITAGSAALDNSQILASAGNQFASAEGNAGSLTIAVAGDLTLLNGGQIITSTWGEGTAGPVMITAGNVLIDGQDSPAFTGIASSANPGSTEAGGSVTLEIAETLILRNDGQILTSTGGEGDAGPVTITAGDLELDGRGTQDLTGIASSAYFFSTGKGNNVHLTVADTLTLHHGGQINAFTDGAGQGGSVTLIAGGRVNIAGDITGDSYPTGLFVGSWGTGNAGNLSLTAPELTLSDGGGISAYSDQTTGGNLWIDADHLKLLNGSEITSSVAGNEFSDGGNVTLNSINIVALNGSAITAQANQGKGGNIIVNAEIFLHDAADVQDVLNASSQRAGNDGTIQNNAPTTTDISGSLVTLSTRYLDVAGQLSPRCSVADPEERSRFIIQERGALPPSPEEELSAPMNRCIAQPHASVCPLPLSRVGEGESSKPLFHKAPSLLAGEGWGGAATESAPTTPWGFNNR
jgi:filamentous hemagglutinin family protein